MVPPRNRSPGRNFELIFLIEIEIESAFHAAFFSISIPISIFCLSLWCR